MNKQLLRIWASALLMEQRDRLRFFTLTVPEHDLPLRIVADRWRSFANTRWWRRLCRKGDYLIVYEPHPSGHGWHIHALTNFFIPWQELQLMASAVHFGHTDIEAVDSECALYVAKYITKSQLKKRLDNACKGVRIVNVSRGLVRLKDIEVHSDYIDWVKSNHAYFRTFPWFVRGHHMRMCWIAERTLICITPYAEHWLKSHCGLSGVDRMALAF